MFNKKKDIDNTLLFVCFIDDLHVYIFPIFAIKNYMITMK